MTHPASYERPIQRVHVNETYPASPVDDAFLSRLVTELDNDTVTAIALVGSYPRGNATPYSDVDVIRFVQEMPEPSQQKLYTYRDGYLVGNAT